MVLRWALLGAVAVSLGLWSGCVSGVEGGGGGCVRNSDCPEGQVCSADGVCAEQACQTDFDCPVGMACIEQYCTSLAENNVNNADNNVNNTGNNANNVSTNNSAVENNGNNVSTNNSAVENNGNNAGAGNNSGGENNGSEDGGDDSASEDDGCAVAAGRDAGVALPGALLLGLLALARRRRA